MRTAVLSLVLALSADAASAQSFNCSQISRFTFCNGTAPAPAPAPAPVYVPTPVYVPAPSYAREGDFALSPQARAIPDDRRSALEGEIRAFAADPRHPYFMQAKDLMVVLLQNGRVKNLQDAYDLATVQLGLVH